MSRVQNRRALCGRYLEFDTIKLHYNSTVIIFFFQNDINSYQYDDNRTQNKCMKRTNQHRGK